MTHSTENPLVRAAPALRFLQPWLSQGQMFFFTLNLIDVEADFYADKAEDLRAMIEAVPALYHYERAGTEPLARLHYYCGETHFYLSETEGADGVSYGFGILNGDRQNAELGYSEVSEMVRCGFELDARYRAEPLADVVARYSLPKARTL